MDEYIQTGNNESEDDEDLNDYYSTISYESDSSEEPISPQPTESNQTKKQKLISKHFPSKLKTKPCTNINNMNDDCLSELFRGQFILLQLIHLRRVCVQWQTIIERLFARKRFLKIFIHKDTFREHFRMINQMIEQARMEKDDEEGLFTLKSDPNGMDDVLVIKTCDNHDEEWNLIFVSTLFHSIQYLFIVFPQNCTSNHSHDHLKLCDMLKQLTKLASLSMKDVSCGDKCYSHWFDRKFKHSLWPALPQLSSVHLFGKCHVDCLPVRLLNRVKRFTVASPLTGDQVWRHGQIVEQLPYLRKCTRLISIGSIGLLCDECLAGGKYSKVDTQLTHLTFVDGDKFFNDFTRFKALTCLDINLMQKFQEFVFKLEKLPNLTELRLKLIGLVEISDQQQLTIRPNQPIPVLSSVSILHLRIFNSYFVPKECPADRRLDSTFLKELPKIFPNLKAAKLATISQIVKDELEMCFKSRGPSHFPLLKSVTFLPTEAKLIDLSNYDGPYRDFLKSV